MMVKIKWQILMYLYNVLFSNRSPRIDFSTASWNVSSHFRDEIYIFDKSPHSTLTGIVQQDLESASRGDRSPQNSFKCPQKRVSNWSSVSFAGVLFIILWKGYNGTIGKSWREFWKSDRKSGLVSEICIDVLHFECLLIFELLKEWRGRFGRFNCAEIKSKRKFLRIYRRSRSAICFCCNFENRRSEAQRKRTLPLFKCYQIHPLVLCGRKFEGLLNRV